MKRRVWHQDPLDTPMNGIAEGVFGVLFATVANVWSQIPNHLPEGQGL